jgi:hypothetical protein
MTTTPRTKHVFFVCCSYPFFQQHFKKGKNSEILVFADVKKRLTSREVSKEPPSDEIVRFHVAKRVNGFMKSTRADFLYYYVHELRPESPDLVRAFARSNDGVKAYLLVEDEAAFREMQGSMDNVLLIRDSLQ